MNLWQRVKLAGSVMRGSGVPASWFNRAIDTDGGGTTLSRPYSQSVWVMRAIKKVSGPISAVELEHYDAAENLVSHPLLDVFWNEPVEGLSLADLVEASVGWLKLAGEVFWVLDDEWMVPFPAERRTLPGRVLLARPDRMRHLLDRDGRLAGWEFRDAQGAPHALTTDQVLHLKFWNPYDPIRGLGEYEAARIAAEADYSAGTFAKAVADSNGDQGVYIVAKSGMPDDAQREQIISQLRLKNAMQKRGEFKPMFLSGDIAIEDPKVRAVDASFNEVRRMNRHEIFIAFGVPASMADKMESYSIGSASDWFVLINETCMPTGNKLASLFGEVSSRLTGQELTAEFCWDEHPVMQAVRRERMVNMDSLWGKGMPVRLISEYLDLGLPEFEGDDVGYMPFGVAPVGEQQSFGEPTMAPAFGEGDAIEEPEGEPAEEDEEDGYPIKGACPMCSCSIEPSELVVRDRDPREVAQWKTIVAKRLATIRAYQSKMTKLLMAARSEVLGKLLVPEGKTITRGVAADFLFNLANFDKLFRVSMRGVALGAFETAGNQVLGELGIPDPWAVPQPEAMAFLAERENKLAGVPQSIFERIRKALEEGFNAGDSRDQIANRVRGAFNQIDKGRSKVIAQTETGAAFGSGRHVALEKHGISYKKWLTSGNLNVRNAHRRMNQTILPIGEPFTVVNDKGETDRIMHPGDPTGKAWNVINCHCVEVAAARGPEIEVEPSA